MRYDAPAVNPVHSYPHNSQVLNSFTDTLKPLSSNARKLFDVLCEVAERVKEHRGYHPNTSQVTFFCPVEVVALVAGVSRRTLYYKLPELAERGLVSQRGHYCSHNGRTRLDGSLWAVRLNEKGQGKAKIDFDYMKKSYRNLAGDIAAGRTAWNIAQSYSNEEKQGDINLILSFAIIPTDLDSINNDCANGELKELLDIPFVPVEARNAAVDRVSHTIARELGAGSSNMMFWRWLVWNLIRLDSQGKGSYFYQVFLMIQRVSVDRKENACRNASGLLVSRLQNSFIWRELREIRQTRVGIKPNQDVKSTW